MIERLHISIPQRMILIRTTLIISLIVSVLLSLNLWGGERTFPYSPVFEDCLIKAPYDYIFIGLAILFWLAALILRYQRLFIFLACLTTFFLVLFDINRLQPWFFMYSSMLAIFIFYDGRVDDSNKYTSFFIIIQLIFASFYFFNGLSQFNSLFVDSSFEQIILPLKQMVSARQFLFFKKLGTVVPYGFIFIGLSLIISPLRYLAITLALIMHFVLLVFLFPSASNTNYALWFSNLSFIILLFFLFAGKTKQRYFSPTFLFQRGVFYPVVLMFLIMPFFNISNKWPDYLSSNFASGNTQTAIITIGPKIYEKLPLYNKHFCVKQNDGYFFDYKKWSLHELKSECFPSDRVFNSIYGYLGQKSKTDVKDVKLELKPKQKGLF